MAAFRGGAARDQIYAFHAMGPGSVGPPMPFGKQWAVVRLLEKRTGDVRDLVKERDHYRRKVAVLPASDLGNLDAFCAMLADRARARLARKGRVRILVDLTEA